MNNILIIEGAQGVGKTSVTTALREQIPYSNLCRLSGMKDKTAAGGQRIFHYYKEFIEFLKRTKDTDFTYIFDRFFLTEMVYCTLGYTGYSWQKEYKELSRSMYELMKDTRVLLILLTAKEETFKERLLVRGAKVQHANIKFSAENSVQQQEVFKDLYANSLFWKGTLETDNMSIQKIVDSIKTLVSVGG